MTASNWLLSSAGRRGHLVAILRDACAQAGGGAVVAIDSSPLSAAGLLSDAFELVPRADDPAFLDEVLQICERYSIRYIVPTIDPELPVYAAAREEFEARGYEIWVSSPEVVTLGTDKWAFYEWLTAHDFSAPATFEAHDPRVATLDGPVIAKPREGSSSIGILRADSVPALRSTDLNDGYIVQQEARGYEVTVDFAVDRLGNLLGLGARHRLEVRAGEVSKAVTIDHPGVLAEVERFVAALPGAFGVLNVQVFVDDDAVYFIELNPRFGGGYPLSWQAGARFPTQLSAPTKGVSLRRDASPGVVMLRFDDAVFGDASKIWADSK